MGGSGDVWLPLVPIQPTRRLCFVTRVPVGCPVLSCPVLHGTILYYGSFHIRDSIVPNRTEEGG